MSHNPSQLRLLSERLNRGGIFLLLLILADSAFIIVHLVRELPFSIFAKRLYSLETDRGYAEIFQYVKMYWVVILLVALWWRTREHVYVVWMLLYAYLLCDDALMIHERGGGAIADHWRYESAFGLRPQDFGELTVAGAFGLAFLVLIPIMYLRSGLDARNASKDLTLLFGVIVFFGVVVDMLHMVAGGHGRVFFGVVEDGGELFAISVVCWYVLNLVERRGHPSPSLWQLACRAAGTTGQSASPPAS